MKAMTASFAAGFMLMLLTVTLVEDSGISGISITLFIISTMLSGIPILAGKIIAYKQGNRLTKPQKSGKLKVENSSLKKRIS